MTPSKKKRRRKLPRVDARLAAHAERESIRLDMQKPSDGGWGTSSGALGLVKAASEEAQHVVCLECGSSGGRHLRVCSRFAA